MKLIVPITLSITLSIVATLIAIVASRLIAQRAFQGERRTEADPANAVPAG